MSNKDSDYETTMQNKTLGKYYNRSKQWFFSGGHLTPNSDYHTPEERQLTMINTNIAPQWQQFNAGNWMVVENAVRKYSNKNRRPVYVVTGTGDFTLFRQTSLININLFFVRGVSISVLCTRIEVPESFARRLF